MYSSWHILSSRWKNLPTYAQNVPLMAHEDDIGARVRAARCYAKLTHDGLGKKLGLERRVVAAIEENNPRHQLTIAEAKKIADVCSVPVSFLIEGWAVNRPIQDRLSDIERSVTKLAERDGELTAHERELLTRFDELIQRLGRDIGRGSARSRGAKGLPAVGP